MGHSEYKKGIYKVVDAAALELWTRDGWQLVEVLRETETEEAVARMPHPNPGQNWDKNGGGYYTNPDTIVTSRPMEVVRIKFLLWLDAQGELALLSEATKAAQAAQAAAVATAENARKEAHEAARKVELLEKHLQDSQESVKRAIAERAEFRTLQHKLEDHVTVLRAEVGAARARQLLGEE